MYAQRADPSRSTSRKFSRTRAQNRNTLDEALREPVRELDLAAHLRAGHGLQHDRDLLVTTGICSSQTFVRSWLIID